MKVHLLNFKAPTPACERTVCGVSLGHVSVSMNPKDVSCQKCQAINSKRPAELRIERA